MTAVEWLQEQYHLRGEALPSGVFQEAKQMEKRQIQNAFDDGEFNVHNSKRDEGFEYETAEQYYDETYKMAK